MDTDILISQLYAFFSQNATQFGTFNCCPRSSEVVGSSHSVYGSFLFFWKRLNRMCYNVFIEIHLVSTV